MGRPGLSFHHQISEMVQQARNTKSETETPDGQLEELIHFCVELEGLGFKFLLNREAALTSVVAKPRRVFLLIRINNNEGCLQFSEVSGEVLSHRFSSGNLQREISRIEPRTFGSPCMACACH